ncbi:MAG: SDR family NAD(P)-dependent oxidoreductase, partial [Gaiellales bacterium]
MPTHNDHPLSGRAALVTGVSRRNGIGFAVSRRLLGMDAAVFAHSWTPHDAGQPQGADPAGIEGVIAALAHGGGRVEHREADFADPDAPAAVVAAANAALGHVDILVVNHARSGNGTLDQLTAGEIDAFLHENVRSALLLVKEF